MKYFVVTQNVATWLLEKKTVLYAISDALRSGEFDRIREADFKAGPVRIACDSGGRFAILLHADYLTGTGDEPLGFINIEAPYGIAGEGDVNKDTDSLERALFAINQRLLNRTFQSQFYYRKLDDYRHKIATRRSADGSMSSLGWTEKVVLVGNSTTRCVLLFGPDQDWDATSNAALRASQELPELVRDARAILLGTARSSAQAADFLPQLRFALEPEAQTPLFVITERARPPEILPADIYRTLSNTFDDWISAESSLAPEQRAILERDAMLSQPVRIVGPAGSGKTLLMQLMAIRRLRADAAARIVFVTHNTAMEERVQQRFVVLGADEDMKLGRLHVTSLSRYSSEVRNLRKSQLINLNPELAKEEAYTYLQAAVDATLKAHAAEVTGSPAFTALTKNVTALRYVYEFVRTEVSSTIKGRGLGYDGPAYTDSEEALSPFHGLLSVDERQLIFEAYSGYQVTLEAYGVLDADDVALTMLAQLKSPQWTLDRKALGYDFVFVDEAQLFTDNERQILPLLTNGKMASSRVVIALDEAQRLSLNVPKGLALIGLPGAQRESLMVVHRLSAAIAKLAFFVISESTALFDDDFPDFTAGFIDYSKSDFDEQTPCLSIVDLSRIVREVNRLVRDHRAEGFKQFAIVAHSSTSQAVLEAELPALMKDLDFRIVTKRGEGEVVEHPFVVLSRPELIGGQEFDCVISCGLEDGLVPPRVPGNAALEAALQQQTLKEIYLAFTRARHRVNIVNSTGSTPSSVLAHAIDQRVLRLC